MRKWMKRGMSLLLAGTMLMGLTACGEKTGTDPAMKLAAKQGVYKYEDLNILPTEVPQDKWFGINSLSCNGERINALVNEESYGEVYQSVIKLVSVNLDGSDRQETVIYDSTPKDGENNGYMSRMIMGDQYVFATYENWDYENVDENGNAPRTMELICWSMAEGGELWRQSILPENPEEAQNFNVQLMTMLENDQVLLVSNNQAEIYDAAGQKISSVSTEMQDVNYNSIYLGKDGKLVLSVWNDDWTKMSLRTLDIQTGKMEEGQELPFPVNNYGIVGSKNHDMLLTTGSCLYKYDEGDAEPVQVMNFINSDLPTDNVSDIIEIDENRFIARYMDNTNWQQHVALFTYVDPKDIPDKEVLTVGTVYTDFEMRNRITEFNKTNEKYRIMLKEYYQYNTAEDYMGGYTQLNNDILAGNVPDIMVIDDAMPIASYVSKGLFADIYDFIDKDEELSREDFLPNVLEAFTMNGKLYAVVPNFQVWTVLGKTADVGTERGWTMQDLQNVMASKPEGTSMFGTDTTRDSIMWYATLLAMPQFMDMETGKCDFDSQGFKDFLTFLKDFPTELDPTYWDDPEIWNERDNQYRNGTTLLQTANIAQAQDLIFTIHGSWGEPVTYIGFPTENGEGSVLVANNRYAISAKSRNKEGAWEFLRYYYSDEYQSEGYSMPVKKDAWEAQTAKAMEKRTWVDETTGETHEEDYTTWVGNESIVLSPLSQEEIDTFREFVFSINKTYYRDQSLIDIINEEAAPFYEGQKSVDEVVEIIQSRAQLYVDESR